MKLSTHNVHQASEGQVTLFDRSGKRQVPREAVAAESRVVDELMDMVLIEFQGEPQVLAERSVAKVLMRIWWPCIDPCQRDGMLPIIELKRRSNVVLPSVGPSAYTKLDALKAHTICFAKGNDHARPLTSIGPQLISWRCFSR
jgi:hypothetical protein